MSFKIQLAARNLPKMDTFGKSDPYIIVRHHTSVVHKTEVIPNDQSPTWKPFVLQATLLAGDMGAKLHFEIFDKDDRSKDDLIGEFSASLQELMDAEKHRTIFAVINKEKQKKKKDYKNSGEVYVKEFHRN